MTSALNKAVHDLCSRRTTIALELGCGSRKADPSAIGIDISDASGVDLVGDALLIMRLFDDDSVDSISSRHFLEHISDVAEMMTEVTRIVKPHGEITITVPHYSSSFYYSDVTHKTVFALYTFCYLAQSSLFKRRVPEYALIPGLCLTDVTLGFKSSSSWPFRYGLRMAFGYLFNASRYLQEFWEENLAGVVSAYEITYKLSKIIDDR